MRGLGHDPGQTIRRKDLSDYTFAKKKVGEGKARRRGAVGNDWTATKEGYAKKGCSMTMCARRGELRSDEGQLG